MNKNPSGVRLLVGAVFIDEKLSNLMINPAGVFYCVDAGFNRRQIWVSLLLSAGFVDDKLSNFMINPGGFFYCVPSAGFNRHFLNSSCQPKPKRYNE